MSPLCRAPIFTHSLLTLTMPAPNKDLDTSSSNQEYNMPFHENGSDRAGQLSTWQIKNMLMACICIESWIVILVWGGNQIPQHIRAAHLLPWFKYILWHQSSSAVLSPTSVSMRQGLASLSRANRQEDISPSETCDDMDLNIVRVHA